MNELFDKDLDVIHRPTGRLYTLKVIYDNHEIETLRQIYREIEILRNVDKPNVVKCHDLFDHNGEIQVLLEYMDGGSLEGQHIGNEKALSNLARQILSGFAYLHRRKIHPPAMTFDEISMERSKSFVKALQELKNLRPQLYSAAEYCEKSYLHSEQKQMQTSDVSTMDLKVTCLNQKLLACKTYMDKEGSRQQQHNNGDVSLVKSQPLVKVLQLIRAQEHGSLFERRLPAQESDKYKSIVQQHVDLETIQTKLRKDAYSSCSLSFYRDLLLLFNNAVVFFPKSSLESMTAHQLRRLVLNEMKKKNLITRPNLTPSSRPTPGSVRISPTSASTRQRNTLLGVEHRTSIGYGNKNTRRSSATFRPPESDHTACRSSRSRTRNSAGEVKLVGNSTFDRLNSSQFLDRSTICVVLFSPNITDASPSSLFRDKSMLPIQLSPCYPLVFISRVTAEHCKQAHSSSATAGRLCNGSAVAVLGGSATGVQRLCSVAVQRVCNGCAQWLCSVTIVVERLHLHLRHGRYL
ncbi:hypothetical protein TB2_013067 [Malus domestica]